MDLSQLMQQAQEMQSRLQDAQDALVDRSVTGTAGGGMVTVEADGRGTVRKVTLDPKVVDPSDVAMLEDLITVAVTDAQRKAQALQETELGKATGGMELPFNMPF